MTESEISLASMSTDHPEFPAMREALLQQYRQLFLKYAPRGSMTRKRSAEPWEVAASGYTAVILVRTETIAGAFSRCWYASGFALTRPVLEALLKQSWLATCNGADGWEHKVRRRQRVTQKELRAMSESYGGGDELADWWKELSPVLSDFVHGGQGQLAANHDTLVPRYPATWFQTTMSIATLAILVTSGLFWAHLGEQERAQAVMAEFTGEGGHVPARP